MKTVDMRIVLRKHPPGLGQFDQIAGNWLYHMWQVRYCDASGNWSEWKDAPIVDQTA